MLELLSQLQRLWKMNRGEISCRTALNQTRNMAAPQVKQSFIPSHCKATAFPQVEREQAIPRSFLQQDQYERFQSEA